MTWKILVLGVALLAAAANGAEAARVALVIGNDQYENLPDLKKAVADAGTYAELLESQGFDEVMLRTDLSRAAIDEAIATFLDRIAPGDTAVFAYSGHGWSDGTQNYLVGTDAPAGGKQELLARLSIPLKNGATGVLDDMDRRGAGLKVAIIDACRDNPFTAASGTRSAGLSRGLTRIEPPSGTFVVLSAGAGQTALDRLSDGDADPNSVFTRVFVPLIRSGLTLQEATKEAQAQVVKLARSIDHQQKPAYYDEVLGNACLSGTCETATATAPTATPSDDGASAYQAALAQNSIDAWDAFLKYHPDGFYADLARAARKKLGFAAIAALPDLPAATAEAPTALAKTIASYSPLIFSSPTQAVLGNPQGTVALAEFCDYNSPYCKQAFPDIKRLIEGDKNLKIAIKQLPVLGEASTEAALVAIAVDMIAPDRFAEFHEALLSEGGKIDRAKALAVAKEVGLEIPVLEGMLDSEYPGDVIRRDADLAKTLGVTGTPSYVTAREVVAGAQGYDVLKEKIDQSRDVKLASLGTVAPTTAEPALAEIITECDRLAAIVLDPDKPVALPGYFEVPGAEAAVAACRDAVAAHPEIRRFKGQLGFALKSAGQLAEARDWFEKAAADGHVAAMMGLAEMYVRGIGVAQDTAEALRWTEKAAAGGSLVADLALLEGYAAGRGPVGKDEAKAKLQAEKVIPLLNQAADAGDPDAPGILGVLNLVGGGIDVNAAKGGAYLVEAVGRGSRVAAGFLTQSPETLPVELRQTLEQLLADRGFSPGPVDGVIDEETKAALDALTRAAPQAAPRSHPWNQMRRLELQRRRKTGRQPSGRPSAWGLPIPGRAPRPMRRLWPGASLLMASLAPSSGRTWKCLTAA